MPVRHFERRLWILSVLIALPGAVAAGVWLKVGIEPSWLRWLVVVGAIVLPFCLIPLMVRRTRYPLRTLSNQIAGMREGDYSLRVRGGDRHDALGELVAELNALGEHLRKHRLEGLETAALLRTVMEEISVAVFAFDQHQRLQLVNRAGEQLLGRSAAQMTGRPANEIGLAESLRGEPARIIDMAFAGRMGRWALRRSSFREQGQPHQLIVITDLSRALREEERQAWKRLIRVLGHELNNSLAPIRSISSSLDRLLARQPRPADWEDDMRAGLGIIQSRSEALSRFMESYSRLAKLPPPTRRDLKVADWVKRIALLETRLAVKVADCPSIVLQADADQLDQLLINLVRNATDAALTDPAGGPPEVEIAWQVRADEFFLTVRDNGPGIAETANLFVPFFTTKPGGSGIGLALCRQITEAHDGSLQLRNRSSQRGAEALVQLPLG